MRALEKYAMPAHYCDIGLIAAVALCTAEIYPRNIAQGLRLRFPGLGEQEAMALARKAAEIHRRVLYIQNQYDGTDHLSALQLLEQGGYL